MAQRQTVTDDDYTRLLTVRTRWREFEHWSAEQAAQHGLTPAQHQLLLAIRGHPGPKDPTTSEAASYLMIRINTAVELINRAEDLNLVIRSRDDADQRVVRLSLTADGHRRLAALSAAHISELGRLTPLLHELLQDVDPPTSGGSDGRERHPPGLSGRERKDGSTTASLGPHARVSSARTRRGAASHR